MLLTSQPENSATPPVPPPDVVQQISLIRQQFPVLIVFAVFVLLLGVYIMEIHWSGDNVITTWLQNKMSDLIAAMLMGLTSAAAVKAMK